MIILQSGNRVVNDVISDSFASYKAKVTAIPFLPTDLPNLLFWYKADSLVASDGDSIGTWVDQSGNGNDAIETNVPNQPIYKTNIINGKPVLRFNSAAQTKLILPGGLINSNSFSVFAVLNATNNTRGDILGGDNTHGAFLGISLGGSQQFLLRDNSDSGVTATIGSPGTMAYYSVINNAGGGQVWQSGSSVGTASVGTFSPSYIGTRLFYSAFGPEYSDMDLPEMFVYSDVKNSTDRGKAQLYMSSKYGI